MNAKKLWWSAGAGIAAIAVVIAAVWWLLPAQSFTLSNGSRLTLLGVTYGKHHTPPKAAVRQGGRNRGGMFSGTNDFLVLWIRQERKGEQWPNYQLYAYDLKGRACAGYSGMTYLSNNRQHGADIVGIRLDAFPRRQAKFKVRVQEWNPQTGRQTVSDAFVIANPARGPFPAWSPESLPQVQSDGDLEVTLNELTPGVEAPFQRNNTDPDDAMNRAVKVAFDVRQNGGTATNWQPVQVLTSDATGNHASGWVNHSSGSGGFGGLAEGEPETVFQWGLWPDEPCWKVRFEFSRTSGFHDDELWTVEDLPVEEDRMQNFWNYSRDRKRSAFAETKLDGIDLKIFPAKHFADQQGNGQIEGGFEIQTHPAPEGMRMTLVSVTDEKGGSIQPMSWGWGGEDYRFGLREMGGAKRLKLTIALHRSRFVEYTVKPGKS